MWPFVLIPCLFCRSSKANAYVVDVPSYDECHVSFCLKNIFRKLTFKNHLKTTNAMLN